MPVKITQVTYTVRWPDGVEEPEVIKLANTPSERRDVEAERALRSRLGDRVESIDHGKRLVVLRARK